MSSALASPTAYAILCTEGLQEMLPLLRADASVEGGAVFDTLALAMIEGHSDARTLTRTAKRLWRATLGEAPAADPDDETTPGWESLRSKLDRCVARAKDSLARSLVGHQARATDDTGSAGVATSGRTMSAAEETDMDARWQASGRRVPGEIFMPSSSFLATMRKYLWPVGHVDTSEGMVVRPSSMEWPAKEQAPIEVVATRKGVHFRPAGKVGVAPTTAYGMVERFEAKLLAAEMCLVGREAPSSYTCEDGVGRVPLSERAVSLTCELLRTLLSTAAHHPDARAIMLSAVNRLDEDVRDYVRQKMSPGAALVAAWPTLRAQIVQVDREGHHGAPDAAAASGSSSPAAAALEQLLATAMAASASPPVAEAPGVASLLASLLAASPVVTKQRSGKARAAAASSPLSGASRHQLNNFLQQVTKAAKPKVVAPPAPKGDPTMVALLALLKGKGAASGGDEKCKNFAATGKCKYGAKCRYTH